MFTLLESLLLSLRPRLPTLPMARTRTLSTNSGNNTPHILIAGLGNAPFPNTRHSVGQHIVSSLSKDLHIPLTSTRHGHLGTGALPGGAGATVTLFKSKHLMNVSGASVADALRACRLPPSHLVLVYDSIAHAPMSLSVRRGGSAQGHNGVKSVMQRLGGGAGEFWQFRVGVGRGPEVPGLSGKQRKALGKGVDAAEWVLGKMGREEMEFWGPGGRGVGMVLAEVERVLGVLNRGDEEEGEPRLEAAKKGNGAKKGGAKKVEDEETGVGEQLPEKTTAELSPSG